MIFLDSSVIVRRYRGRQVPASPASEICLSDLSQVEVASALRRHVREGTLDPGTAEVRLAAFRRDLGACIRVPVDGSILEGAAMLVARHPLHSLDAIQLASALSLSREAPQALQFLTGDRRLAAAAKAEGLEVPGDS